jgi:hypothetical protein
MPDASREIRWPIFDHHYWVGSINRRACRKTALATVTISDNELYYVLAIALRCSRRRN